MTCPICDGPSKPRAENPTFPFCSPRCKTIDLGNWLSEAYRVPVEPADDQEAQLVDIAVKKGGDVRH